MPSFSEVGPICYSDSSFLGTFPGPPTHVPSEGTSQLCTITYSDSSVDPSWTTYAAQHTVTNLWVYSPIAHIPFLFPHLGIVGTTIMATLNLTIGIHVWYSNPPNPIPTPQVVLTPIHLVQTAMVPPTPPDSKTPKAPLVPKNNKKVQGQSQECWQY